METTSTFTINEVGETTGRVFSGEFKVKTVLTRRESFRADQLRREIVGASPEGSLIPADVQLEGMMIAQLQIRIVKGPQWWTESNGGLELEDLDIIAKLFGLMIKEEGKAKLALKKEATGALEKLAKQGE